MNTHLHSKFKIKKSLVLLITWEYTVACHEAVTLPASSNNAKCGVDGRTDGRVLPLLLYQHTHTHTHTWWRRREGRRRAGDLQCKTGHLGRSRGEGTGAVANNKSCVPPPRSKPADGRERESERERERKEGGKKATGKASLYCVSSECVMLATERER